MTSLLKRLNRYITLLLICWILFHYNIAAQGIYQNWGVTNQGGSVDNIGVIFSTDSNGANIKGHHSFSYINGGANPGYGAMLPFNGKLYGLTVGDYVDNKSTLFEFDPATGKYTRKVTFTGIDGSEAVYGLTAYNNQLYSVGTNGGINNWGVIFKFDPVAGTYQKLFDMAFNTGAYPSSDLVVFNGKMYGLTEGGGQYHQGVLFEFDPGTNVYTKKLDFDSVNGGGPTGLCAFNSKLYGLAVLETFGHTGNGVVFEYDPVLNVYSKKVEFSSANGKEPFGNLVAYNNQLWDVAAYGGANDAGVIFSYDPFTNTYTKKIDMTVDGGNMAGGNLIVQNDRLFGMTSYGGQNDDGVLFEYDPQTNVFEKKIDFNGTNGRNPLGSLTLFNDTIYGCTYLGGLCDVGVLFEYNSTTGMYTKKIDFNSSAGYKVTGSMAYINKNLYGLAEIGGVNNTGVLFKYGLADNKMSTEVTFDSLNGSHPKGELFIFNNMLYGTTENGGLHNKGVLFGYDPVTKIYSKLVDFDSLNGSFPGYNNNICTYNQKLYGTTAAGGLNNGGVIFQYDPSTATYTKKFDFYSSGGTHPYGSLVPWNGKLYGLSIDGGDHYFGTLFEYDPAGNVYTKKFDFDPNTSFGKSANLVIYGHKLYGSAGAQIANEPDFSGALFEYDLQNSTYTKDIHFQDENGSYPDNYLLLRNNLMYGMTTDGGTYNQGTIFRYNPDNNSYAKTANFDSVNGGMPLYNSLVSVPAAVADGDIGSCLALPGFTVDDSNNRNWVAITDQDGDAVGEISPNGNNLGTVNASLYVQNNPVRNAGGFDYLNRSLTITVQNQPAPGHPVDVRLYIKKTELDDLINTPNSGITSVNDLVVYKSENTCSDTIGSDVVRLNSTAEDWGANYVLTTQVTAFSTFHFASPNATLPLTLVDFTVKRKNSTTNQIDWQTTSEINSDHFNIERSDDGIHFISIGTVAANGTGVTPKRYQFTDKYVWNGDLYYRLKISDKDGKFTYSKIVQLPAIGSMVIISPDPVLRTLTIQGVKQYSRLQIIDVNGKLIQDLSSTPGNQYDVSNLRAGVYLLRCIGNDKTIIQKFVKQ